MPEIKLNKKPVDNSDFNVIPEIPNAEAPANNSNDNSNATASSNKSFVKEEETPSRKLFANKKANIALIIAGAVVVAAIIAAVIFVSI